MKLRGQVAKDGVQPVVLEEIFYLGTENAPSPGRPVMRGIASSVHGQFFSSNLYLYI